MKNETPKKDTNNILKILLQKVKSIFSKKKMIPEPQVVHYDEIRQWIHFGK